MGPGPGWSGLPDASQESDLAAQLQHGSSHLDHGHQEGVSDVDMKEGHGSSAAAEQLPLCASCAATADSTAAEDSTMAWAKRWRQLHAPSLEALRSYCASKAQLLPLLVVRLACARLAEQQSQRLPPDGHGASPQSDASKQLLAGGKPEAVSTALADTLCFANLPADPADDLLVELQTSCHLAAAAFDKAADATLHGQLPWEWYLAMQVCTFVCLDTVFVCSDFERVAMVPHWARVV